MCAHKPIRLAALLCLAIPAYAQSPLAPRPSQIPATQTSVPATRPQPALSNRPQITYTDHKLTVQADNSSLNQILHDISQLTGITITGGVAEERVFGSYGPGSLSQVLNEILDGTSSNMFFVSSVDDKPAQLILTPRTGGPTPPSPNAGRYNDSAEVDDNPPVNPPEPPDESSVQTHPAPASAPGSQPVAQPVTQPGPTSNTSTGSSTDPSQQSPNGVRTPQQIFDQLMKLRQQQHPPTQ